MLLNIFTFMSGLKKHNQGWFFTCSMLNQLHTIESHGNLSVSLVSLDHWLNNIATFKLPSKLGHLILVILYSSLTFAQQLNWFSRDVSSNCLFPHKLVELIWIKCWHCTEENCWENCQQFQNFNFANIFQLAAHFVFQSSIYL